MDRTETGNTFTWEYNPRTQTQISVRFCKVLQESSTCWDGWWCTEDYHLQPIWLLVPVPPSASASASAIHVRVQSSCILIPLTLFNGTLPTKVKAATQHKSSDPMSFTSLMGRTILRMLKVKWWKRERESDLLTARCIYTSYMMFASVCRSLKAHLQMRKI